VVFWAPLVHTEPLTMVLVALGLLGVVRRLTGAGSTLEVAAAGVALGLGVYVRQSALAGVLAALGLLVLFRRPPRAAGRDCLALGGGYLAVVLAMLGWYARRLSLPELWNSSINPLQLPIHSLLRIVQSSAGAVPAPAVDTATTVGAMAAAPAFRSEIQPWSATVNNLRGSVSLSVLLLAGCLIFLVYWLWLERRRPAEATHPRVGAAVVLAWSGSLALLYGYWILHRGFYPQYAVEFLPPLALGAGHGLALGWAATEPLGRWRIALALPGGTAAAVLAHGAVPDGRYTSMAYAVIAGLLAVAGMRAAWLRRPAAPVAAAVASAGIVWLILRWLLRAPLHPADGLAAALVIVALVVAARVRWPAPVSALTLLGVGVAGALAIATAVFSLRVLEPRYFCVWSPQTLREVAAHLHASAPRSASVMSGAVIWEFVADRRPFARISHPLAFQGGGHGTAEARIDSALVAAPPDVVVLDGYTEQTYFAESAAAERMVQERYRVALTVSGSRYPVRILLPKR
jgi:hypothetical protein